MFPGGESPSLRGDDPRRDGAHQNVMLQLSMRPTSPLALSFTRSVQVPFKASVDRFTE